MHDSTAVRMMTVMMAPAHGMCMVFNASVNGDSPERTVFQGVTATIRNSEIT
jgi:hypothetical protein